MKIKAIRVDNFMRLREIDVGFRYPLSLFVGTNDVGKTSIQEAIRLAFTGEAARVKLKKNYHQMIRKGAKSAAVIIEWSNGKEEGRAGITLPSNKGECNPSPPAALPYVLDAPRFAALDEDARRKFLFNLIGVQMNVDAVKERLAKRDCRHDLVSVVLPILRTGFEPAYQFALDKQRDHRADWKRIAGEEYGEKKADTWRALLTGTELNSDQITSLQQSITAIAGDITLTTKELGAGEAYLGNKARYDREAKGLKEQAGQVGRLKRESDEAERSIGAHRPVLEKAEARLADARLQGQPCPACGTLLALQPEGKLIEAPASGQKELATIEKEVEAHRATMRILTKTHTKARADYEAAILASEQITQLERAMGTPMMPERLGELRKDLAGLEHEIEDLTSKMTDLQKQNRAIIEARMATDDAKKAHQLVLAWGVIADSLAPDGVPGDLLKEALVPINRRLKKSAEATGWSPAQIEGDMGIAIGAKPEEIDYGLCGESTRWKSDAMIAESISHVAGLKLLVLDRFDVLAPERRGALLDWCDVLAEEGYQILLFGSLKGKPELSGTDVYWLSDGRIE